MGAIPSTIQLGVAYCCCNSAGSLCNTCLGSTAAGTTGRKRSVLLLAFTITLALLFQYSLAPFILKDSGWFYNYKKIPGLGKYMYQGWIQGCDQYTDDNGEIVESLYAQCVSNAGVYRPTFISTLFFLLSAAATKANPLLNREAWPAKYGLFFISILVSLFIPNGPLFTGFYVVIFRILAMMFILIQQVILVDMAYNWNDSWVEKSNECDNMEWGSGVKWLRAIIGMSIFLLVASITGIGFLYHHFTGCAENTTIITLTLIGIFGIVVVQLSGTDGSLLTTSVISAYATYLAYSVVSKNPNGTCNPTLGNDDVWGIVIGLMLTLVSLAWAGWSWTAQDRLNVEGIEATRAMIPVNPNRQNPETLDLDVPFLDPEDQPTTGVVVEGPSASSSENSMSPAIWKLNVTLAMISCFVAASLTGWGAIQGAIGEAGEHTAANPQVGRVNMMMIALSQQVALILYAWTLLAPRIFPDRDFS